MPTTVRYKRPESEFDRSFRRAGYIHTAIMVIVGLCFAWFIVLAISTPAEERARYQCAATLNPDECYRMLTGHDDPAKSQPQPRHKAQE